MGNTFCCKQEKVNMITTYTNPSRSLNRRKTALKFLKQFSSPYFQNLGVVFVECAFGDQKFDILPDESYRNIRIIHVRSNSLMWLKENLINRGYHEVPLDVKYIVWCDSDLLFSEDPQENLCRKIIKTLKLYPVAQLFTQAREIGTNDQIIHEYESYASFLIKKKDTIPKENQIHYGFFWGIRRNIIPNSGFFDYNIIGNGDKHMALAFMNKCEESFPYKHQNFKLILDLLTQWEKEVCQKTQGIFGYLDQNITHICDENNEDEYSDRWQIFEKLAFNPYQDLRLNEDGIYEFTMKGQRLLSKLWIYFSGPNSCSNSENLQTYSQSKSDYKMQGNSQLQQINNNQNIYKTSRKRQIKVTIIRENSQKEQSNTDENNDFQKLNQNNQNQLIEEHYFLY